MKAPMSGRMPTRRRRITRRARRRYAEPACEARRSQLCDRTCGQRRHARSRAGRGDCASGSRGVACGPLARPDFPPTRISRRSSFTQLDRNGLFWIRVLHPHLVGDIDEADVRPAASRHGIGKEPLGKRPRDDVPARSLQPQGIRRPAQFRDSKTPHFVPHFRVTCACAGSGSRGSSRRSGRPG